MLQKKFKIWFSHIVLVVLFVGIAIAFFFNDISLEFGSQSANNYTNKQSDRNIDNIQYMSWYLWVSPIDSWENFNKILKQDHKSLKMQTYEFTQNNLKKTFEDMASRWTQIKIIIEDKKFQQFTDTFKELKKTFEDQQNIQIKSDFQMKTNYVHSKYTILDSWFVIKTANLTNSSFNKNREYFFFSQNTWVLASLNLIFDKDRSWKQITNQDIHPNLVVCNINCRTVVEKLLDSAQSSIIIQNQYITDPSIMEILKSKIDQFARSTGQNEIRIILANTDTNNYPKLSLGKDYVKIYKKNYMHAKMILIDKKLLLISSINLSENSMDNNREIWILVNDTSVISKFLSQFEKDWKMSN